MYEKGNMPKVFEVKNLLMRNKIKNIVLGFRNMVESSEKYCEYVLAFVEDGQKIIVKQYESGKLVIQGNNHNLISSIIYEIEKFLEDNDELTAKSDCENHIKVSLPAIGSDESGKGDFFGPLVVCAFWANSNMMHDLNSLEVKDSKSLSEVKCSKIAAELRKSYPENYVEIILCPEKYNVFYSKFNKKGLSLNQMLGYLHACAINKMWDNKQANSIVIDKFGKESDVTKYLKNEILDVNVVCVTKGERQLSVAAASILARDRFICEINALSEKLSEKIPLGAGSNVLEFAAHFISKYGEEQLFNYAKIHFSTASKARMIKNRG